MNHSFQSIFGARRCQGLCWLAMAMVALTVQAVNPKGPKGILDTGRDHWAYQPLRQPTVPPARDAKLRNAIDHFIADRLSREGLSLSPEAARVVLIRRMYLDLLGLPPEPEEVRAFVADARPSAFEDLLERLLASPHYGERWARHWLDTVRFAESNGFETNTPRRNAWPYRDYVIRAFNEDKPFDRFVLEQLAGDALGEDAATGFIVGGPWDEVKSPDVNLTAQQRMDELHDMVATTGSAFLGTTIGCARCHNHKFDPVTQVDYYAMQAVFAGVQHGERPLRSADEEARKVEVERLREEIARLDESIEAAEPLAAPNQPEQNRAVGRQAVNARLNIERFTPITASKLRFTVLASNQAEPCLDELEIFTGGPVARNVALASAGATATASGTYPNSEIHRLEHINDGKYGNGRSWISNEQGRGWVEISFARPERIEKVRWARDREEKFSDRLATTYRIEALAHEGGWVTVADSTDREAFPGGASPATAAGSMTERKRLQERLRAVAGGASVYAGRFVTPGATHRLHRGEPLQKREELAPALPEAFAPGGEMAAETPERERRLALARWIADPGNPLTARVMVNRLWQFHFGAGIVETPSDFGLNGAKPSHPELLDWLAAEFTGHGWSLKHMHRLIMSSAVYRQAGQPRPEGLERDAGSRLLWRFPARRLEAEALRDSILQVCGNLDLAMGGPGFDLFEPNENYVRVFNSKREFTRGDWRRMVYLFKHRMQVDDTFGAFDCPDAGQIAPVRTRSTTPLQALSLLHSPFMAQQAELLAARLRREAGAKGADQVARGFEVVFGRSPGKEEAMAARRLVEAEGLAPFCQALLNANEFVYIF